MLFIGYAGAGTANKGKAYFPRIQFLSIICSRSLSQKTRIDNSSGFYLKSQLWRDAYVRGKSSTELDCVFAEEEQNFVLGTLVMVMNLRIRDLREDADLTQKQISEIILCDQSLYSKYERGERVLPFDLAVKLADYYQVSLDYLFGRSNKRK